MRLTIFNKLLLGFLVALSLTAAIAGIAVVSSISFGKMSEEIIRGPQEIKYLARKVESQLRNAITYEKEFMLNQGQQSAAEQFNASAKEAKALADTIVVISTDDAVKNDAKALGGRIDKYTKGFGDIVWEISSKAMPGESFGDVMQRDLIVQGLYKTYADNARSAEQLANNIVKTSEKKASSALMDLMETSAHARTTLLSITAVALVLGFALAFFIARTISRPISQLNYAAQQVAAGKHDVSLQITTRDEVGELGQAFTSMVGSINTMVSDLNKSNADISKILGDVNEAKAATEQSKENLEAEVGRLLAAIDTLAKGDFSQDITGSGSDEIGKLRERLNSMVQNLRRLLFQVKETVSTVAHATTEISSAAEQLSSGVENQAQQTEEVSLAMDNMTRTIAENSRNAAQTSTVAVKNGEIAKHSSEIVRSTVAKMNEIADVVLQSTSTIERLGASSAEIGEIVSVITEIADQTNLLALNAAIEAARAGEQGRGFAVVADEVRKLAERTAQATKQITGMIQTIQRESNGAVQAMKQGNDKVREGIELASKAGQSLQEVLDSSQGVLTMVQQIADASQRQTSTSEGIASNVEQISSVSSESAAGVADIARTAADLQEFTHQLEQNIAQFKVRPEDARQLSSSGNEVRRSNFRLSA